MEVEPALFVIPLSVAEHLAQYGLDALSDREYHLPPLRSFRYANWRTPKDERPWHVAAVAKALGLPSITVKRWILCDLIRALSIGKGRFVIPAREVAALFQYGLAGGGVVNGPPHLSLRPWKPSDLATRMGVIPQTVVGWVKEGKLPAIPMGRHYRISADVAELVAQLGIKGYRRWMDTPPWLRKPRPEPGK